MFRQQLGQGIRRRFFGDALPDVGGGDSMTPGKLSFQNSFKGLNPKALRNDVFWHPQDF